MSYTEKIDVLDLLIGVLKDHENDLDGYVTRLEAVADTLAPAPVAHTRQRDKEGQGLVRPEPSTDNTHISDQGRLLKVILLRTPHEHRVAQLFLDEIYLSAPRIMEATDICEATVYRTLKHLRERGIITLAGKIKPSNRGGPATKIWKMKGVNKKWE